MSNGLMFSIGTSGNIALEKFDEFDALVFNPGMDATYQLYANSRRTGTSIGLNGGFAIYNQNFYAGYAMHNLFSRTLASDALEDSQSLYHFVMAGMSMEFSPEFFFQPAVLLKYADAYPLSIDINARLKYRQLGWVGFSYRNNNDVVGMLGLLIDQKINLGYSFDFGGSDLGRNNSGTHEVVLSFRLGGSDELSTLLW
jgi:type IX secretion system PorP/SprF family membrane protein